MDDDGDTNPGTTTVQILNKVQDQGIFFEAYSPLGFLLSSGIRVMGPCAVFPKSILHWNVSSAGFNHSYWIIVMMKNKQLWFMNIFLLIFKM